MLVHVCMCVHALAVGPWNTEVVCGVQDETEYRCGRKTGSDSSAWVSEEWRHTRDQGDNEDPFSTGIGSKIAAGPTSLQLRRHL